MRKICVMAMLLIAIGGFANSIKVEAAGGCSNYYCLDVSDSYCEDKGCGFLWLDPQTNYQDFLWIRDCINGNGDEYCEFEVRTKKLGCC